MKHLVSLSLGLLVLTGCAPALPSASPSAPTLAAAASFTAIATLTNAPSTLSTPHAAIPETPDPTITPTFRPFIAVTSADNLALRKGPGYLFTRIGLLPQGASLLILATSRGGEWAMAQTVDGRVGWVFVRLLDPGDREWATVPSSEPPAAQLVTGVVKDQAGVPISGIQFAFTQGDGALAPRTDAMTDETGTFYAYFPDNITGRWYLSYTAIACTSNTMDAACNPKNGVGGEPDPASTYVTLPLNPPNPLQFIWK